MVNDIRKLSGNKLYFEEKEVNRLKETFSLRCWFPLDFDPKKIEEFGIELKESIKSISSEEETIQERELTLKEVEAKQLEQLKQIKENYIKGSKKIVRFLSQTKKKYLNFRVKRDYGVMEAEWRFLVKERWKHVKRIESRLRDLNEKVLSKKKRLESIKEKREQSKITKELRELTKERDEILEAQEKSQKKQISKFLEGYKHRFEELLTDFIFNFK